MTSGILKPKPVAIKAPTKACVALLVPAPDSALTALMLVSRDGK
jgi:hypothetical protein